MQFIFSELLLVDQKKRIRGVLLFNLVVSKLA